MLHTMLNFCGRRSVALFLICLIFPITEMASIINRSHNQRKFSGFMHLFPKTRSVVSDSYHSTQEPERNISIPFQFPLNHLKVKGFSIPSPRPYFHLTNTKRQSPVPKEFEMMMTMSGRGRIFMRKTHVNNHSVFPVPGLQVKINTSRTNTRYQRSNSMRKVKRHSKETFTGADIFSPLRNYGLVCKLCIVMDSEFILQHGNGELSQVVLKLEIVVDSVSWIFRATDWNEDGLADNIGFHVEIMKEPRPWISFKKEDTSEYGSPKTALLILGELGKLDFRKCCLGLGFTMRPFKEKQVGISIIASSDGLGGLCDHRSPDPMKRMKRMTSGNLVLISGAGPNPNLTHSRSLQMSDLMGVLLHELGHAFGVSKHDNEEVAGDSDSGLKQCSGHDPNSSSKVFSAEPPKGRYIMWGRTSQSQGKRRIRQHNLLFSQCSKVAVANILSIPTYSSCLIPDYEGFCGNGIMEDSEECDCGSQSSCEETPHCCGSRSSPTPCKILRGSENDTLSSGCLKFQRSYDNFTRMTSIYEHNFKTRVIFSGEWLVVVLVIFLIV